MASNYPTSLDSFDTIASDKKTSDSVGGRTHRDMHNDLGDAIESVQGALGTSPAGDYDTVEQRLVAIEGLLETTAGGDGVAIPTLATPTTPTNLAGSAQSTFSSLADWTGAAGGQNNAATISTTTGPDTTAMLVEVSGAAVIEGCRTTMTGLTPGNLYTVMVKLARVSGPNPLRMKMYCGSGSLAGYGILDGTGQVFMAMPFVATGTSQTFSLTSEVAGGAASFRVDRFGYWLGAGGNLVGSGAQTSTGMTATSSGIIEADGSLVGFYLQVPAWGWQYGEYRSPDWSQVHYAGDDLATADIGGTIVGGNHDVSGYSATISNGFAAAGRCSTTASTFTWTHASHATVQQVWRFRADSPGAHYIDLTFTANTTDTLGYIQGQANVAPGGSPEEACVGLVEGAALATWGAPGGSGEEFTSGEWADGIAPSCLMSRGTSGSVAVIALGDRTLNGAAGKVASTGKLYIYSHSDVAVDSADVVHARFARSWSKHSHDRAFHVVRDGAVARWFLMAGSTGQASHPSLPQYEGAVVVQTRGTAAVDTVVDGGEVTVLGEGWAEGVIRTDIA